MGLDIGKMRHRIEIQNLNETENEVGETTKSWSTYRYLWAERKQLKALNPNNLNKEAKKTIHII